MGVYLTISSLVSLSASPYPVVGLYASLYSYSFADFLVSHLCLGINHDAFYSRPVPLLRSVKMERKGLEERFVTLVATRHPLLSNRLSNAS
jgi:hypothetical protein